MSAVSFITSLARKILARESKGITTIPNRMSVESKAGEIAAILQDAGIPLNRADEFIKSEQDLTRILNLIESTPPVMREVPSGIRSTKSAKIMDMEGKEIDPRSKIMGGKQSETEAEIAERLSRENKEAAKRFKDKMKDDPENMAQGGRAGFKDGMSRRKFLQIMGGLAALPIVGKFFKAGKVATKAAPIVKTPPVAGKPEWFDSLVNKVITEGDDMTKQFATKEREIVHATKIDNDAFVTVTRDLDDGKVRVDINDPTTNVMDDQGDAIVSMEFKPGMADETTKGAKPADEFTVTETDYRNYQDGPDDFITEATENTVTDTKDLTSDLTKVKMYAKGQKKPTIKEMMIQRDRAKSLRQAEENPAEYAADRGPNIDYSDYDDFASGGIARMLGE